MDPDIEALDRQAMTRLVNGHDAGLTELMERHAERLFHFLIRMLHDEEEAEDVAQESFVRVYQNRDRFDPERKFTTWLYTIATNLARDRLRWRARHPESSLETEHPDTGKDWGETLSEAGVDPSQRLEAKEQQELVRHAVAALPDEMRVPLILSEYEERSHAEIGAILNCTPKAVEMRLYRARHQLRQSLAGLLG